jgi:hypothetical protein
MFTMEEKPTEVKLERTLAEKKVYTPPSLNIYGKLTELTASGTRPGMENGNMTMTEYG